MSPIARTVIKSRVGDIVSLRTPQGLDELEIVSVDYTWFGTGRPLKRDAS
ncbi:MAG: GreA/GreB family elongation factor [Betaproteobacteria bacterium]